MSNMQHILNEESVKNLIQRAFEEDLGSGDVTTNAIVSEDSRSDAVWVSKEDGIIAGLDLAHAIFQTLDPGISWQPDCVDGDEIKKGFEIVKLSGQSRALLSGERIALNFVQRLSGIATFTSQFVQAISEFPTRILDTRKTAPGFRLLDKYAVKTGGAKNHRMGLFDLAMIKDNHIVAAGGIQEAVMAIRDRNSKIRIEVETTSLKEVEEALTAGADIIMLDNMSYDLMKQATRLINGKAETEASGNVSLSSVQQIAETGVDYISIGSLTHSVEAFDISQKFKSNY